MRKTISVEWLMDKGACDSAIKAFTRQKEMETCSIPLIKLLIRRRYWVWARWLAYELMTDKQKGHFWRRYNKLGKDYKFPPSIKLAKYALRILTEAERKKK